VYKVVLAIYEESFSFKDSLSSNFFFFGTLRLVLMSSRPSY